MGHIFRWAVVGPEPSDRTDPIIRDQRLSRGPRRTRLYPHHDRTAADDPRATGAALPGSPEPRADTQPSSGTDPARFGRPGLARPVSVLGCLRRRDRDNRKQEQTR